MQEPIINQKKIHRDAYTWEAVYQDGTTLREWVFEGDDIKTRIVAARYDDIDRSRLAAFNVFDTSKFYLWDEATEDEPAKISAIDDNVKPQFTIEIQPGQRLIWRKKRRMRLIGPQEPFMTIYMFGWQMTVNGSDTVSTNIQSIVYIYHAETNENTDDDIVVFSGSKDDEGLDYQLFPFETVT